MCIFAFYGLFPVTFSILAKTNYLDKYLTSLSMLETIAELVGFSTLGCNKQIDTGEINLLALNIP